MNELLTDRQPLLGRHSRLYWLGLAVLIIILDWYSKQWASDSLVLYQSRALTSWLNFTLAHNYGAAFSILSDAGGWQRWLFTILAGAVTLVLLLWLFTLKRGEWRTGLSLGLIIGGAAGNLVDRVRLGYVVDFIDVYYKNHHWPAFNVADSAITCGIVLMLIDAIMVSMRKPDKNREDTGK